MEINIQEDEEVKAEFSFLFKYLLCILVNKKHVERMINDILHHME